MGWVMPLLYLQVGLFVLHFVVRVEVWMEATNGKIIQAEDYKAYGIR